MTMDWGEVRHRVAIAGRVTDAISHAVVPGAMVRITEMPDDVKLRSDASALQAARPGPRGGQRRNETRTSHDGHYYFLDLPKGKYVLTATGPGRHPAVGTETVKVSVDRQSNVVMTAADIAVKRGDDPDSRPAKKQA